MPNLSEQLNAISSSNHFEKTTKNKNTNKKSNDIVIDIPDDLKKDSDFLKFKPIFDQLIDIINKQQNTINSLSEEGNLCTHREMYQVTQNLDKRIYALEMENEHNDDYY